METTELIYPVFEANQVLSNAHLNDMFEYLDEQTRLTRADLIGIGIVCGLEAARDPGGGIRLTRGCGVTSQGYLIVENDDVLLTHVRKYTLPFEVGYQPFMVPGSDPAAQHPLWELFDDDDEPGAIALATSGLPLDQMAVVLFLELRQDRTRNCSPKGCDDRGSEVTTSVRRLLVDVGDLRKIIEAGRSVGTVPLGVDLAKRLQLPDLRMPRFDVPNTGPVTSEKVLQGFQAAFRKNGLATATAAALSALYAAFEPLVGSEYPAGNPFAGFAARFGFLDGTPVTVGQARFMQYYWDFFDDLLAAYDEVRAKGIDLLCACCPPQGLFPRHLVAGVLAPSAADPFEYRTRFVPSPAVSDCAERSREVRLLFRRLVLMIARLTEAPGDKGIRATPSRAAAPLSAKAIPYYYRQDVAPRLYESWNPQKTRERRAEQNLAYRADEYAPPAPAFVTDPLRFDLEPSDFLRIEGHLGKDVQTALESLLALRRSHRLPIDVIALRTGVFDENMPVDLTKERCRFRDLETLYETLKAELECFLVKEVEYFYAIPMPGPLVIGQQDLAPTLPLLARRAPDLVVKRETLGHAIERARNWVPGQAQPFAFAVAGVPHLPSQAMALTSAMSDLAGILTDDVRDLDFGDFTKRYGAIVDLARAMDRARRDDVYDEPGLSDRLDDIVYRCRRDPFDAIAEEYRRRVREVKQEQFLSTFLERHPGVQHKAGVPLGGTFILVYHEDPAPASERPQRPGLAGRGIFTNLVPERLAPARRLDIADELLIEAGPQLTTRAAAFVADEPQAAAFESKAAFDEPKAAAFEGLTASRLWSAVSRLGGKADLLKDADVHTLWQLLPALVPQIAAAPGDATDRLYAEAVAGLADGTVIADFFLPYGCRSDCPPIQYQLPPTRLRVSASKGCTNVDGFAEVTLTTEGGIGDLSVQIDHEAFTELVNPLLVAAGDHTLVVRDATGNESSPLELAIPPQLVIHESDIEVDAAAGTYRVRFTVAGGTPPYLADVGIIADTAYTSPALKVAETLTETVTDAAGCTVTATFESGEQPCGFPCDGVAVREGFRFWLPEARPNLPINAWEHDVRVFTVTAPDGTGHDVTDAVREVLARGPASIRSADFEKVVRAWLEGIEKVVVEALGAEDWLRFDYGAAEGGATTGTLFADRVQCASFAFELGVTFAQGRRTHRYEFGYTAEGTIMVDAETGSKFRLPPFSVSTSNRCRPGEPAVPRCEGTDLKLEIVHDGSFPDVVTFAAGVSGGDLPIAFLWEVQDGIPQVAGGEKVEVTSFEPVEPTTKVVRLTAFTEKGCTVTVEESVDIVRR